MSDFCVREVYGRACCKKDKKGSFLTSGMIRVFVVAVVVLYSIGNEEERNTM